MINHTVKRPLFAALLLSFGLWACTAKEPGAETSPAEPGLGAALDLSAFELVDLSHAYGADTLYWPTDTEGFRHDELAYGINDAGFFYSSYSLCTAEHGGTHLDAPIHFAEGAETLDQIPLERLLRPAVVLDFTGPASAQPDATLGVAEIEAWETANGRIPEGAAVLLRTGWDQYWPDAKGYLGDDTPGDASNLHFPSFGAEAARLLVAQRGAAILGIDTASIDHGPSTEFLVHRIAAERGVLGLENLTGLEKLPATGAWIVALPMKIRGGSGGPVRVIALLPRG